MDVPHRLWRFTPDTIELVFDQIAKSGGRGGSRDLSLPFVGAGEPVSFR